MEISQLFTDFYQYCLLVVKYQPSTINRIKQTLSFFQRVTTIEYIEDVDQHCVDSFFVYGQQERIWSPHTVTTYHKSLNVFFDWCVHREYIDKNYTQSIRLPKPKTVPRKALTQKQAHYLLKVVHNYPYPSLFLQKRNDAIFTMFLFTGLRKNELLSLCCEDIDVHNSLIHIRNAKGGTYRVIPICSTLMTYLRKYLKERRRLKKKCPYFFTSFNRDAQFTDSGLKHLMKNIRDTAGIYFTIHILRHTFATLMLQGGCNIYDLSKLLGHQNISTTAIYLSSDNNTLRTQLVKHPLSSD